MLLAGFSFVQQHLQRKGLHKNVHFGKDATKEEKETLWDTCSPCPEVGQRLLPKAPLFLKEIMLP